MEGKEKNALTLVELLVILGLIAIVTAIILPTIPGVGTKGLGMQCQLNLQVIYQAVKLYHLDYQGYPPFDFQGCLPSNPPVGRGLLSLYSFPQPDTTAPLGYRRIRTGYLNSPSYLHCPLDRTQKFGADEDGDNLIDEELSNLLDDDGDGKVDEMDLKRAEYCSYQVPEDFVGEDGDKFTYLRTRTGNPNDPDSMRQLSRICVERSDKIPYFADDTTVITWCKHHRRTLKRGKEPADLVLFLDGHIKIMEAPSAKNNIVGWRRKP
ncbi:MAG: type II secretion system protein [Armatimonadota bacterium]|nr:type II secretion system GspH family protein [Armatimonadota bacterium]MCX7778038.1 type II secretion system GspH family protein [Armatimonadota bacterium]MDW8024964.1 type II secretion system protein [Armatimonadota bacterium]